MTKPNGFLYLGVPGGSEDEVQYNAHRVYGKYRWPLITTNWQVQEGLDMNKNYLNDRNTQHRMYAFRKTDNEVFGAI